MLKKKNQRNGIGKIIINEVELILAKKKVNYLWMNARVKALKFYLNLNYIKSNISFDINEIGLHYMLYKKL